MDPAALDVPVAPGVVVRAHRIAGPPGALPVLLVADAGASGVEWPDALVGRLASRHPVIRYDHRDTGRSTRYGDAASMNDASVNDADAAPYGVTDLAADAVAVLDAFGEPRAHAVGLGLGGRLVQLLLLDHPERIASAVLLCTAPLPAPGAPPLPAPDAAVARLWAELDDPRDAAGEIAWRVAHQRLLHGTAAPFDAATSRRAAVRAVAYAGTDEPCVAHLHLGGDVPERGAELGRVAVPVLVVEGPADPVHPPPSSAALAARLGDARMTSVPGLGHVLGPAAVERVADAVLEHLGQARTG